MTKLFGRLVILAIVVIAASVWHGLQNPAGPQRARSGQEQAGEVEASFWARPETLGDHFRRHGADFQALDPGDYARQAHAFLLHARKAGLPARRDAEGTLRIFDPSTGTFGAYNADDTTRTYFKPGSPGYFERQPGTPVDLRIRR